MEVLTYSQYCKNRMARKSLGWAKGFYIYEGSTYTKEQIESMFPIHLPIVDANNRTLLKGENACKKGNYIKGQKSY
jgi:hypothetical protein